jgi:hypothetical protein
MTTIFLDESGDLGFSKKGSSKYFIITILAINDKRPLEKIVKATHSQLRKRVKSVSGGALHSYKEKQSTRIKLLQKLAASKSSIMTIILDKSKVYTRLHEEKHVLYNYVTNILLDRIIKKKLVSDSTSLTLIASKFANESQTQNPIKNRNQNPVQREIPASGRFCQLGNIPQS